jgi:prepilin-type N-terminal cleavage/methylation domain-containing protein
MRIQGNRGFTLFEVTTALIILSVLGSLLAIPKYLDVKEQALKGSVLNYMSALKSALVSHIADHHLRGTAWVQSAEDLSGFLEEGPSMPEPLEMDADTWIAAGLGMEWRFERADDGNRMPPRIITIQ